MQNPHLFVVFELEAMLNVFRLFFSSHTCFFNSVWVLSASFLKDCRGKTLNSTWRILGRSRSYKAFAFMSKLSTLLG